MAKEIERKFLLNTRDLSFLKMGVATEIVQGYMHETGMTSRVRIAGGQGFLTLKGKAVNLARDEYEYPIPRKDAEELLQKHAVGRLIYKTRYAIPAGPHIWEVDVFAGHLTGLIVAEIELNHASESFAVPAWLGAEVTHDKSFTNKSMALSKRKPLALIKLAA